MSVAIEIRNLTKRYDTTVALEQISFEVQRGEIMGFLGPNGAGKTTTLRILTGILAPTSGSIRINGLDAETQSLEVRRQIGYLPENVALYPEMRVQEYLDYRARIKGVPARRVRQAVADVTDRCALTEARRKLIGRLSKGYRQRVGLADCLIAKPSILILDEPTVGLDPHQIRQTRELITVLGQTSTVLLSTHILPEVEMTCQRVTIINEGKIVAVDTPANLRQGLSGRQLIHVELRGDLADVEQALRQVEGVARVQPQGRTDGFVTFEIEAHSGSDVREAIFHLAVARQWPIRQLAQVQASLEDVFIHLTTHEQDVEPVAVS